MTGWAKLTWLQALAIRILASLICASIDGKASLNFSKGDNESDTVMESSTKISFSFDKDDDEEDEDDDNDKDD